MAQFQKLICSIALQGSNESVVVRSLGEEITYPELLVIKALHGGGAVMDVLETGYTEDREHEDERKRLMALYGDRVVQEVFGLGLVQPLPVKGEFMTLEEYQAQQAEYAAIRARRAAERAEKKAGPSGKAQKAIRAEPMGPAEPDPEPAVLIDPTHLSGPKIEPIRG